MSDKPAEAAANRQANGQFGPGNNANPGGRRKTPEEIKLAFSEMTPRAMERLKQLIESQDERVALAAVKEVLDRDLGKPTQPVAMDPSSMTDQELRRAVIDAGRRLEAEEAAGSETVQ